MLKKDITFENLDGVEVTKTYYFHLSKADLAKLNFSEAGGLEAHLQKMVDAKNEAAILENFEKIIRMAYGVRRNDDIFDKSAEMSESFIRSEAYSELLMELMGSAEAVANFVNGVIPASVRALVPDETKENGIVLEVPIEQLNLPTRPIYPTAPTPSVSPLGVKSDEESVPDLQNATPEELRKIIEKLKTGELQ